MNEGTVFIVVSFPHPWPLTTETKVLSQQQDKSLIEIDSLNNGAIKIRVSVDNITINEFVSQPLRFDNIGQTLLTFSWTKEKMEVFINSNPIKNSEHQDSHFVVVKQNLPEGQYSTDDPEANNKCLEWVKWRLHRYANLKEQGKTDRRIKSIEEQIDEFSDATQSLETLLTEYNNGKTYLFSSILPILRSLLFWPDNSSGNYNPLLFRIAGYYKIALPLYAFPVLDNEPDELMSASKHITFNEPLLKKRLPNQILMDFQEWLNSRIYIERIQDPFTNSTYPFERILRFKDLIFEASNTIGTAHFDDDIPIKIDNLMNTEVFGRNFLVDFVMKISHTTLFFSNYMLEKINEILMNDDSL
jgi:hypothetical protein